MTTPNTEKKTLSKRNLELRGPLEPKHYGAEGQKTLHKFPAVDKGLPAEHPMVGKPITFTVFSDTLTEYLKGLEQGTLFAADYEVKPRPETEYGPDFTIVQVYKPDGSPVSQKRGGGQGGQGGGYRRPEDDLALEAVKRRSIEGQTAISQVMAILLCDRPLDKEKCLSFGEDTGLGIAEEDLKRVVKKTWQAVERQLDNYLAGAPTSASPQTARQTHQDDRQPTRSRKKEPEDKGNGQGASQDTAEAVVDIKHAGDLLTHAGKLEPPVTRAEILEIMSVNDPQEITDLAGAWKSITSYHARRERLAGGGESSDEEFARMGRERGAS